MQQSLFDQHEKRVVKPFKSQLLKWIGNKQRFSHEIASYFPPKFGTYFEPFFGSGAIAATLAPEKAVGSDNFEPLMEIWKTLKSDPHMLKQWYSERWHDMMGGERTTEYEKIKAAYNSNPNGADLVFLCRSCYGGVVRFRKADGHMSTPCGPHTPISPHTFSQRVDVWHRRTIGTNFVLMDYREAFDMANPKDLIYCDPPYSNSQTILYGAQSFRLEQLFEAIDRCKSRGVYVALSIDGTKRSGNLVCNVPVPEGLFEREVLVNCGRSMLKRFQMEGRTLEREVITDRLLLNY